MRKLWILVLAVIAVLVILVVVPGAREATGGFLTHSFITPLNTALTNLANAVSSSPVWQTWIGPNLFWIGILSGWLIAFVFVKKIKSRIPRYRTIPKREIGYQETPTPQPAVIPQASAAPVVTPQPVIYVAQPAPAPVKTKPEEEKES